MTDALLRRVAKLITLAAAPAGDPEGDAARRELARLAAGPRGLRAAELRGEHAGAAAMVVREGTGCEVVRSRGALWAVGTERQVSDALAACAYLCDEWSAAWSRSQAPQPPPASAGGPVLFATHRIGGIEVRMHFTGHDPELMARLYGVLGPRKPSDRTAFVLGLAQGAFARVCELRARRGLPQRPPSILVREEVAEAQVKAARVDAEARHRAAGHGPGDRGGTDGGSAGGSGGSGGEGSDAEQAQRESRAAAEAAHRARAEAARRAAESEASMRAGRDAGQSLRVGGITLRLREMPPALPPHVP